MNLSRPAALGAGCWAAAAPLFLGANVLAGLAWHAPRYSWANDNISDLGNVSCGIWDTSRPRYVCSPAHAPMNAAFLLTALLLAAGLLLAWPTVGQGRRAGTARSLLLLAAVGYGAAGAFPADAHENLHFLGAVLVMGAGNIGLLIAGPVRRASLPGRFRVLTLLAGLTAGTGSVLFFTQHGLGLGVGGMERVAVLPLPLWASGIGVLLLWSATRSCPHRTG